MFCRGRTEKTMDAVVVVEMRVDGDDVHGCCDGAPSLWRRLQLWSMLERRKHPPET